MQWEEVPVMLKIMYLEAHEFTVDVGDQLAAQAVVRTWGHSQTLPTNSNIPITLNHWTRSPQCHHFAAQQEMGMAFIIESQKVFCKVSAWKQFLNNKELMQKNGLSFKTIKIE